MWVGLKLRALKSQCARDSKTGITRAYSPHFLSVPGASPQAVDRALALQSHILSILSAEGAYISLGRSPRNKSTNNKRAVSPLNWRVLRQPLKPRPTCSCMQSSRTYATTLQYPWAEAAEADPPAAGTAALRAARRRISAFRKWPLRSRRRSWRRGS